MHTAGAQADGVAERVGHDPHERRRDPTSVGLPMFAQREVSFDSSGQNGGRQAVDGES